MESLTSLKPAAVCGAGASTRMRAVAAAVAAVATLGPADLVFSVTSFGVHRSRP